MKKMVIGVVAMLMFQFCTSELNEIDGIIDDHVGTSKPDDGISIPVNSFLGQYFTKNKENPISARVESKIKHDFSSPVRDGLNSDILGAKWTGDFLFEKKSYAFNIKSNKNIRLKIDGETVLDVDDNNSLNEFEVVKLLDGVHRIVVQYNNHENSSEVSEPESGNNPSNEGTPDNGSSPDNGGTPDNNSSPDNSSTPDSGGEEVSSEPVVPENSNTPTVEVGWEEEVVVPPPPVDGLSGLFYTQREIDIWRERASANFSLGRFQGWGEIKRKADLFLSNPDNDLYFGPTPLNAKVVPGSLPEPSSEGTRALCAAFVGLVKDDPSYFKPVINFLVEQAQIESVDFTDNRRWENYTLKDLNPGFIIAEWAVRLLHTYDYVKDYMTPNDKIIVEDWLYNVGRFFHYDLENSQLNGNPKYLSNDNRANNYIPPSSYNPDELLSEFTHRLADGTKKNRLVKANVSFNNRESYISVLVGLTGVFFNDDELKNNARWFIQNSIANQGFPDGTNGELRRSAQDGNAEKGWLYTAVMIDNYQIVADAFYRNGDPSLYEFVTDQGYGFAGNQGKEVVKNAQKTILLGGQGIAKYVDSSHSDGLRYRANTSTNDEENVINGHRSQTGWYGVHETWYCQMNQYYKDSLIEKAYKRQLRFSYPSSPFNGEYSYMGAGKTFPDKLFMFYEMEY